MKRRDLLRQLRRMARDRGVDYVEREGGRHSVVCVGEAMVTVPRHREINEMTARNILRTVEEWE